MSELMYADYTLLMSVLVERLDGFLSAVKASGANFGLALHGDKIQLVNIRCGDDVRREDRTRVRASEVITYLCCIVSAHGWLEKELGLRLGLAHSDLQALSKVWRLLLNFLTLL